MGVSETERQRLGARNRSSSASKGATGEAAFRGSFLPCGRDDGVNLSSLTVSPGGCCGATQSGVPEAGQGDRHAGLFAC